MPEFLILTRAGKQEIDERYSVVEIDLTTATVGRISDAMPGDAVRALLEARGESQWCIGAKLGLARAQLALWECGTAELARPLAGPQGERVTPQRERSRAVRCSR